MKEKIKLAFKLFLIYFKIGLFTFGGGYAMISLIQKEFAEKRKMITEDELLEIIAIAESTPGPIAINSATFIGFKACGVLGALFATIGVVLPSFVIIMLISLVFDQFMQFVVVQNAFKGIQVAVGILIVSAGIKMFKKVKKTPFTMIVFVSTVIVMSLIDIFVWSFSSIYLIIIGGVSGMLFYAIGDAITTAKTKKKRDNSIPVDQNQQTEEKSTGNSVTKDELQNGEIPTEETADKDKKEKYSVVKDELKSIEKKKKRAQSPLAKRVNNCDELKRDELGNAEKTDEKAQGSLAKSSNACDSRALTKSDELKNVEKPDEKAQGSPIENANNCDNSAQRKGDELKRDELLESKDNSSAKEKKL